MKKVEFSPLRLIDLTESGVLGFQFSSIVVDTKTYQEDIILQRHLASEGLDSKLLSDALARLPRLEAMDVDAGSKIHTKRLISRFGVLSTRYVATWDSEYTLPLLIQVLLKSQIMIKSFKLGGTPTGPNSLCAGISPQALAKTFSSIDIAGYKHAFE